MGNSKPLIGVIDWALAPVGDATVAVEREVAGDVAEVKNFFCDGAEDFTGEVLDARALIVWHNAPITAEVIEKLQNCRVIIRNGVGYDSVDVAAAARRGIAVCNVPDYGTEEVADHAIALALTLCRQIIPLDAEAKNLGWSIKVENKIHRLSTRTFALIGLGSIGTATALRAKAFGFDVVFYDPFLPAGTHKSIGIRRVSTLDKLLTQADVLSLHCPLNELTRHLIGERELNLLKPTTFIVNTARGAVIDKVALFKALRENRIAGAGLDVVEDEPLRTPEEAATPNLIVTPHAAFYSVESKREMRSTSARIARNAVMGEPLENFVPGSVIA